MTLYWRKNPYQLAAGLWLAVLGAHAVSAQTLDEQYEYYLADRCENLNIRGIYDENLVGENLINYCNSAGNVVTPPGSTVTVNSSGGASATSGVGASVVRRRESDAETSDGTALDVYSADNIGVFLTLNNRSEDKSATEYEAASRSNGFDFMLGADYRIGEHAVLGGAYSQMRLNGDFFNGGDFEKDSKAAWFFGAWFPAASASIDFSVGIDQGKSSTRRIVGRQTVIVSPSPPVAVPQGEGLAPVAQDYITTIILDIPYKRTEGRSQSHSSNATLNGSYDFTWSAFIVGPRMGLALRRTTLDAFEEAGDTPMTLAFDKQIEKSVLSTLGLQASRALGFSFGVINIQLNVDWLHEWSDKQRTLTATFAEDYRPDAPRLHFLNQAPDQNWLNTRIGGVAVLPHGLSAFMTYEYSFAHEYLQQKNMSIGLRKMF